MATAKNRPLLLCGLVVAALTSACDEPPEPVGRVTVEPAEIRLLYPGFSAYRLTWAPEAELANRVGDLRASVHLKGPSGEVLRTFDHALDFEWSPGADATRDQTLFQSALAPPLEEGSYELEIGLYDGGGSAWSVASSGVTVSVEAAAEGFPAFYFSPEWLPIEGGTDLQILGRRWLRSDGLIRLGELTEPGTLWLQIGVPVPIEGEHEMRFDEGASGPEVVVSSSCGVPTQVVKGVGSHHVMLDVAPGEDGALATECELSIDANYTLISIEDRAHRTVALESLSWLTTSSSRG